MKPEDVTFIKRRLQQVESQVNELDGTADTLHDNGVDTTTSQTTREGQEMIQDELELLVSDILAVLNESDTIGESDRDLPGAKRVPVSSGQLPEPRAGNGNSPPWTGNGGGAQ